jgi:hypothetical protein
MSTVIGAEPDTDIPVVFDPDSISSLTGHADDREFAFVFVTRYRRLLPERLRRIISTLEGDGAEAMEAVLSLKVASRTLGAGELAAIGARIERCLRRYDVAGAVEASLELAPAASRAERALTAYLAAA